MGVIPLPDEGGREEAALSLVRRLQGGDPEAFDDLYHLYLAPLYGYMVVALHDHHEAEDATHEVFLRMLVALPTYEIGDAPFRAWVFRIARNHVLDRLSRLRRSDVSAPAEVQRLLDDRFEDSESVARLGRLSDDEFLRLIQWLPLSQRQVLVLRHAFDLSFAEVGVALGITEASARNMQRRAFAKLRPRLTPRSAELQEGRASRFAMRMLVSQPRQRWRPLRV